VPRRAPLLPIFLVVLVDVLGLTIVIPLLSIYAESLHATPFEATLLVPVYAVCQLVSGPLLGRISDRTGRRPMLLVSQVGTFLGFLLMARASALWMLYVARAIDGATAGNLSLAQAYISDNTEPKDRAKSFALIGIAFGLGFLVGPGITAWLSTAGLNRPIYAAAGLSLLSILCTFFLLPKEVQARAPASADGPGGRRLAILDWSAYAEYFRRPVLRGLLFQFLGYMFAFQTFTSGFALFAERRFRWDGHPFTPREIGALFAYVGLLGIVFQGGMIGRLVARFGEHRLAAWGFSSLALGYFLLSGVHVIPALLIAATFSAFGTAVVRPTLTSLITQSAGAREQGVVLGLTQSLSSVAAISAPPLAGFLIGRGLLAPWAWVAGTAAVLGLLGSFGGPPGRLRAPSPGS
jgi:MFS transporter, DHA1 family, tetracycline resistance protein